LLSANGGFREYQIIDEDRPNDLLIKTFDDADPLLEKAKVFSEQPPGKDFRHAMVIPMSILDRAMRDGWLNDKAAWKKVANDSANANLRTWKGRL
jgi:hypothetical protein